MNQKAKYPGVLGQRSSDVLPVPPPKTQLGEPSERAMAKYQKETTEWVQRQVMREIDGIIRLFDYYGIEQSEDRFLHLALALAREHVPYFMPPKRGKGRPKKTQEFLPIIDVLSKAAKSAGKTQKMVYEQFAQLLEVKTETIIREVKRFRSQSKGGKNN